MKLPQYYKIIGLIFKIPKEAFEGIYTEKNCPFTSYVSIWGLVLPAVLTKMKLQSTTVIHRDYLHYN